MTEALRHIEILTAFFMENPAWIRACEDARGFAVRIATAPPTPPAINDAAEINRLRVAYKLAVGRWPPDAPSLPPREPTEADYERAEREADALGEEYRRSLEEFRKSPDGQLR